MKKVNPIWMLTLFFIILSSFSLAELNITEPIANDYYTYGAIDAEFEYNDVGFTNCYYYFNFSPRHRDFDCSNTTKISVPYDGIVNLTVIMNSTTDQINGSTSFTVNRNLSTGKGFILLGMILFPIIIIFFLVYIGTKFDDEHRPLKYFLYLSGLTFVFVSYYINLYIINNFVHSPDLVRIFSSQIFSWIYLIIIVYFFIYWTYTLFIWMAKNKRRKLEY